MVEVIPLNWLKEFWAKHTITTHSLAVGVATLVALYSAVPAFHDLVYGLYSDSPAWAHKVIAAGVGIWAFYQGAGKTQP